MGPPKKDDPASSIPMYYKEANTSLRETRFFLKPVQVTSAKGEKRNDLVNVQVVRGKTTTFIHLDDEEAKKVWTHGDAALKRVQQVHKSVAWNFFIGRASLDGIQKSKASAVGDEINIDKDENLSFDATNARSWSEESLGLIRTYLKALQFSCDGIVILFCIKNETQGGDVDYDEMAWELEKCLTYHFIAQLSGKNQMIMNEEATMARRGLDPVSRKSKCSGKNKPGFCVYLAYQLFDNVTHNQMVGEALNQCVDMTIKRKQLLQSLTEAKIPPQIDEKIRKSIKELKEFMSQEKLELVFKLKELNDPQCVEMLAQFMQYLMQNQTGSSGGTSKRGAKNSSFMGLPQFIAFLNQSNDTNASGPLTNSPRVDGRESSYARSRAGGGDVGSNAGTYTAIPRPRNSSSATGKRKSSFSSQFTESRISSQSMTPPETPRSGSGPKMINSVDSKHLDPRLEASLASIASSGQSELSASDTLGRPENKQHVENGSAAKNGDRNAKPMSNSTSKLPKRAHSLRDSAPSTSPRQVRNTSRPTSSTPRKPPSQLLSNVEKHNSRGDSAPSSISPRGRDYRQAQGSPRISDGSKFARSNGHRQRAGSATPSIASSSGGGVDSPSRSIASRSSNSRNTPTSGKMITREDLRRMNRSTPSTKKEKQPSSYSRTSIPMS